MPLFDFICAECNTKFDAFVKKDVPIQCPNCQSSSLTKLVSAPSSFEFKGTGFYQTDFKGKK